MKNLAIKGHATRGKEVVEILEMLGGVNTHNLYGDENYAYYTIDSDKEIKGGIYIFGDEELSSFTLEEFLEKFPYKVGDMVITNDKFIGTITDIKWQGDSFFVGKEEGDIVYTVQVSTTAQITYQKEYLQPYKEETMEETIIDTIKESADRYRIKVNYQFDIEVDEGEYYVVRRKPQYPKTFEDCCRTVNANPYIRLIYGLSDGQRYSYDVDNLRHYENIRELLICRDAYWKIAGEEMGLGKPWKPDYNEESYEQGSPIKYVIYYTGTYISKGQKCTPSYILAFPTAEMRDAFYENFKDLIEDCKELL